ncbi:carboxypeptidase-like regulatory domain-containing protein [Flavobacteriales bacterium]|nr:carboxypeptidase-like regulatory domain-containing protein [Flavobacteriales bacterium]
MILKINSYILITLLFLSNILYTQNIIVEGSVVDEFDYEVPFAAVGILKKNIGTTSTMEGSFSFLVTVNELDDELEISSIGFETLKINVREFINRKDKKIILKEKLTALDEVVVKAPINYVNQAIKLLKVNTISKSHQLNILYRRWDVEENKCRFFLEHFIKAIDQGPNSNILRASVENIRKSSDYRFVKNQSQFHPLRYTEWSNPLRKGIRTKSYNWKKIGNTSYDGEDVLIFEGIDKEEAKITLYIGYESYKIYRLEYERDPDVGRYANSMWIYKKNISGKLYLTYMTREWVGARRLPENVKRTMISSGQKVKEFYPVSFRHELFVTKLIEEKSKFDNFSDMEQKDMSLYRVPYNKFFWQNFSVPPETKVYRDNIKELESLYGVPIETQFLYSN